MCWPGRTRGQLLQWQRSAASNTLFPKLLVPEWDRLFSWGQLKRLSNFANLREYSTENLRLSPEGVEFI